MRKPYLVNFQNIYSDNGVLNIFEVHKHVSFEIKRIFILNDLKDDTIRGNHAHKNTDQLLICLNGEIEVFLEMPDSNKYNYILTDSKVGLFLPAEAWHYMKYKNNSIQLVCASQYYDEQDYLRTKEKYHDFYKNY